MQYLSEYSTCLPMNDRVLYPDWWGHKLLLSLCVCDVQGLPPLLLWVLLFLVCGFFTSVQWPIWTQLKTVQNALCMRLPPLLFSAMWTSAEASLDSRLYLLKSRRLLGDFGVLLPEHSRWWNGTMVDSIFSPSLKDQSCAAWYPV